MKLTPPAGTASDTAFKYSVSIFWAPAEASGFKLQLIGQVANLFCPPALYVTAQFVVFFAVDLFTSFNIMQIPNILKLSYHLHLHDLFDQYKHLSLVHADNCRRRQYIL